MATNPNENPELIEIFCSDGIKDEIPEFLKVSGYTPENPNPNGYVLNKIFNQIFQQLNHQKEKGFSFWESTKAYTNATSNIDLVRRNNKIYYAKSNNTNKTPENNPNDWGLMFDIDNPNETLFLGINDKAVDSDKLDGKDSSEFALLNGNDTQTFKVANAVNDDEAVNKAQIRDVLGSLPILNIVSVRTKTQSSTTSSSFQDVPDMVVSITPKSTNSKILVLVDAKFGQTENAQQHNINLDRNGRLVYGNSHSMTQGLSGYSSTVSNTASLIFIDEPNSTSVQEYKLRYATGQGTMYFNRSDTAGYTFESSMILIEIGA